MKEASLVKQIATSLQMIQGDSPPIGGGGAGRYPGLVGTELYGTAAGRPFIGGGGLAPGIPIGGLPIPGGPPNIGACAGAFFLA